MNDRLADDIAIEVPKKAPKIELAVRREPIWSVTPTRARRDERITKSHHLLLHAIGSHVDEWGRLWPTAQTLGADCRRRRAWVFAMLHDLTAWGYIRKLEWWDYPWLIREAGLRKRKHWPALRQVLFTPDWPKPPARKFKKAEPPLDPTLPDGKPWPWRAPIYQPKGEDDMETHQSAAPDINDEKLRRRAADAVRERALFDSAQRVAQYFADRRGRAVGEAVRASFSEPTAKKWLLQGFSEAECREHVDTRISEWLADGLARERFPYTLSDVRFGAPQRAA